MSLTKLYNLCCIAPCILGTIILEKVIEIRLQLKRIDRRSLVLMISVAPYSCQVSFLCICNFDIY